jgi:hypothetical protein
MKARYKRSGALAHFCLITSETAKLGENELGMKTVFGFLWNFC